MELFRKLAVSFRFIFLGGDVPSRLFLFALPFLPFLRKKLGLKFKKIKVNFNYNNINFNLYLEGIYEEIVMIKEIFLEKCYAVNETEPKAVIDLGANIGISTVFFAASFPDANIAAVEPDPHNFKRLEENIRDFKNVKILNCAVCGHSGSVEFFVNSEKIISSSVFKRQLNQKAVQVKSITIYDLLKEINFSGGGILKFDIEGAEYDAFKNFNFSAIDVILAELHPDLMGKKAEEFIELLLGGFIYNLKSARKNNRFFLKAVKRNEQKN